jgi:para-aminobenzoate synthetase
MVQVHRILLVDSYDSFTYKSVNFLSLCRPTRSFDSLANLLLQTIPDSEVYILTNDSLPIHDLIPHLSSFSAIVVGPGPGSPCVRQDIGIVKDLWRLSEENLIPIFGVCLGLQSLAVEHGWAIARLPKVKHGAVSAVRHAKDQLFHGIDCLRVVRYHSLHVFPVPGRSFDLEAIAWADDEVENGEVVMAIKHTTRPFWAVQYHPESVCTTEGSRIVINFWDASTEWSKRMGRDCTSIPVHLPGVRWPPLVRTLRENDHTQLEENHIPTSILDEMTLSSCEIMELLNIEGVETSAVLTSAAVPGRYSIIACPTTSDKVILHTIGSSKLILRQHDADTQVSLSGISIWDWLQQFVGKPRGLMGHADIPFWGGLIGFVSYSAGFPAIGLHQPLGNDSPDVVFWSVTRSIVLDHQTRRAYIQSLNVFDEEWVETTMDVLRNPGQSSPSQRTSQSTLGNAVFHIPEKEHYIERINMARAHLAAGDSYELCVTANTYVDLPHTTEIDSRQRSWGIFKKALKVNPAPYACYIRAGGTTLISSSPERFMSCDRNGKFQLRPIKGTVRKSTVPSRSDAELILSSPKEFAENLMIVDLIRHDLFGCVGTGVHVSQLCGVEEYKTVWHSVSVIEGQGDSSGCARALGACLPPG